MAILTPDKITTLGGVTVKEYLLTKHNPNHIDMPTAQLTGKVLGVTIHNTDRIKTAAGTTPAEQYTRATVNGNMKTVRVHYYVDSTCAWQNLPLSLSGWHAADGSGNGNRRTIAIECIMNGSGDAADKKAEDNTARLAAALLKQYGLGTDRLYTHTHWLNVRDGKSGSTDQLNTMHNSYKMCPAYILPHWAAFKAKVQAYLNGTSAAKPFSGTSSQLYRVRKSANDMKSQLGAYASLENAKKACKAGYSVFDSRGKAVYTNSRSGKFVKGQAVHIGSNVPLFANETTSTPAVRLTAGTYYIYDGVPCKLGRYRVTTTAASCGKKPAGKYVTGYVSWDNFK